MFVSCTRFLIFPLIFSCILCAANCAKMLGVFPMFGASHYKMAVALMRGLADAGNDVTIVCSYPDKYRPKNGSYRNIILEGFAEAFESDIENWNLLDLNEFNNPFQEASLQDYMYGNTEKVFTDPGIRKLIETKEIFDAVIIEQFSNDALKVLSHIFKSHLVLLNTYSTSSLVNGLVANPTMLSYVPQVTTTFPRPMCFSHRLYNTLIYTVEELMNQFMFLPRQDRLIKKYFPDAPSVYDLNKNVSLLLVNSHETMWQAVPLVPSIKLIGGFHIVPPKQLPDDIQTFLDSAKDGAVFFSLGSNLRSTDLPKDKLKVFLDAFGKLKQKVLWKLEGDVPGLPPNVKTAKWLPQMDILAHSNVQLFITHGGILSMMEAIYNGVPVLAIPVYGDQATNGNNAAFAGFGLSVVYKDFTEEQFNNALDKLLNSPSFKFNAIKRSRVFHDRPMKPLETATYWVNYVVRHNGAAHLRVDGLDMPFYQYLLIDVVTVLATGFFIIITIILLTLKSLFRNKIVQAKVKKN